MENEVQKIMDQINQLKIKLEMQKLTEQMNKLKAELALAQKPEQQQLKTSEIKPASPKQQTETVIDPTSFQLDLQAINQKIKADLQAQFNAKQTTHQGQEWSDEQVSQLKMAALNTKTETGAFDWDRIAQQCGRSVRVCKKRYKLIKDQINGTCKTFMRRQTDRYQSYKWSRDEACELNQAVIEAKENGEVDWDQVAARCRKSASVCRNFYLLRTEPNWTAEQNEILLSFWNKNCDNFDVSAVLPMLGGHTKRGALFKLEKLSKMSIGSPLFNVTDWFENEDSALDESMSSEDSNSSTNLESKADRIPEKNWDQEQLQQLNVVVGKMLIGGVDWSRVAQQCGRSALSCKRMYNGQIQNTKKVGLNGFTNYLHVLRFGKIMWQAQHVSQLQTLAKTMTKNGKIDWETIGQLQNRSGLICFNKYIQLAEPEWTAQENEILLKCWEENWEDFDVAAVMPKLGKHTERGAMFQLEDLTAGDKKQQHKYLIKYIDNLNFDGRMDYE